MKKTMLTCKTLDRFEAEYNTAQYTPDEIEKVEFAAYVANMNTCNHSEWTESDIFKEFLRVLAIDKITVTKKESPRAGGKQMKAYNEIKKELEARKDRSAWSKGVTMYALELLEEYQERAAYEGREAADRAEFKAWLLNGAPQKEPHTIAKCTNRRYKPCENTYLPKKAIHSSGLTKRPPAQPIKTA